MAELVNDDGRPGADRVEVAFADNATEGEMIRGLLEGGGIASFLQPTGVDSPAVAYGLLGHGAQRVMVRPEAAQDARRILSESLFANEPGAADELPDSDYPEDPGRRKPRRYGLIGGYARAWAFSIGAMALVFAVFLLLHG